MRAAVLGKRGRRLFAQMTKTTPMVSILQHHFSIVVQVDIVMELLNEGLGLLRRRGTRCYGRSGS